MAAPSQDVSHSLTGSLDRVLQEVVDTFKNAFSQMKSIITETVGAFRPYEVEKFEARLKDLSAVFGSMLLPVMQEMTQVVKQVADYFYSLPNSFKETITAVAKIVIELGALATVAASVGAVFGAVGAVLVNLNMAVPVLVALTAMGYQFVKTAGGAKFLTDALTFGEQMLQKWYDEISKINTVGSELAESLSDMGKSMSGLLDALKPIMASFVEWFVKEMGDLLKELADQATVAVNALTELWKWLKKLADDLGVDMGNAALPNVNREKKDSFGLGAHGGRVTDPLSAFKSIQEQVFKNMGGVEKAEDKVAKNTEQILALLRGLGLKGVRPALPGEAHVFGMVPVVP
jgi:hypothetical protein